MTLRNLFMKFQSYDELIFRLGGNNQEQRHHLAVQNQLILELEIIVCRGDNCTVWKVEPMKGVPPLSLTWLHSILIFLLTWQILNPGNMLFSFSDFQLFQKQSNWNNMYPKKDFNRTPSNWITWRCKVVAHYLLLGSYTWIGLRGWVLGKGFWGKVNWLPSVSFGSGSVNRPLTFS